MPFLAEEHLPIPTKDILSWIFGDIKYDQDRPIYIDAANPSRTISARQARSIIQRLIAGFKAAGLRQGDCICIHAFNDICYSLAFLAIVGAGGIFAGTNPAYTPHELAHAIRTADIKFLLVEPALLTPALAAAQTCNIPPSNILLFNPPGSEAEKQGSASPPSPKPANLRSWPWLLDQGSSTWHAFDSLHLSTTTSAARLFSSGTTGLPKALDMTHRNFVAQHTLVMEHPSHAPRRAAAYEVRRLLCNPMFHVSQVPRAHTSPLRGGYVAVVMRRFDVEAWLRNIEVFGITEANTVPMMVNMIVTSPFALKYSMKGLRNAWSGAAPMSREQQARFKALIPPDAPFNQVWGMSETSCIATMLYWPEEDTTGGVGKFLPNHDAKIVDDDGKDITDYNVRGELCVRGPLIVSGYYRNEEANKRDWDEEGYFHTGDIAYCDRETKLWYIVDRKKELIKVRGFQVAPAEIEGVLLSHPVVTDAAVIGVTLTRNESELPRAYIVLKAGVELTEKEVLEYTATRLAKYKRLDGGVKVVDSIPKNASGKILKKELRARAAKELGTRL